MLVCIFLEIDILKKVTLLLGNCKYYNNMNKIDSTVHTDVEMVESRYIVYYEYTTAK